jgi:hypothetical protein
MNRLAFLFVIILLPFFSNAQYRVPKKQLKEAKDSFSKGNYKAALKEYIQLERNDSRNVLYHYRIGICYLNINGDKSKAIRHLEYVTRKETTNIQAWFELGRAYQFGYRFDDAINVFSKLKSEGAGKVASYEELEHLIEKCYNAKELVKFPVNVRFENLGKIINTEYPDYYPFINDDETIMVYTTRRKGNIGGIELLDGFYTSDIMMSLEKNGTWDKAKNPGATVNTMGDDEAVGLSHDGARVFIYSEDEFDYGDILVATKKGQGFQKRLLLDRNINTDYLEVSASISSDGNMLFFSSDRNGGEGQLDIYFSRKLPTGQWALPVNLGPNINTKYNEDFPVISADGKILYFCSQGHYNMGGFDIFKSEWDEEKEEWTQAENIGYPVNTPEDNMTISFNSTGRHAYVSAWREDSFGDLDIYRVVFEGAEPNYALIRGSIKEKILTEGPSHEFHIYKRGSVKKDFPTDYKPIDPTWKFVESKNIPVKEGFEFKTVLIFEKDGKELSVSPSSAPTDPAFVLKDVKNTLVKKVGNLSSAEAQPAFAEKEISEVMITVTDKDTNEIFGTYLSQPNGKYILIIPPGKYIIGYEAEGYDVHSEYVVIVPKNSRKIELEKDVFLSPLSNGNN